MSMAPPRAAFARLRGGIGRCASCLRTGRNFEPHKKYGDEFNHSSLVRLEVTSREGGGRTLLLYRTTQNSLNMRI